MKEMKQAAMALVLGAAALAAAVPAAAQWENPREMKIPALNQIKPIAPERVELANGMIVYFLEDHEFPLVDVNATIRVGSVYEPADKVGLASITGQVMRSGGSTKTAGDALDERLESLGASVETFIGQNSGGASVSTLSEDLATGIEILGEILRTPAFPDDKIDLAKKQERTSIAARNDELFDVVGRELGKLIYGADSPYARHTEYATIDAITRDDLVAFHREYFHPDRIIMTVYGDFNTAQVKTLLNKTFGDWAKSVTALPEDPAVEPSRVSGVFLANKDNSTNSAVLIGHEGIRMDNPDYANMMIYHEVMGGGLTGRLFNQIRSTLGLAYATGSSAGAGLHHPGAQFYYAITQSDSTAKTLKHLRTEIAKSLDAPFTEKEVQAAKDAILNSLVFTLSSKGAVLNRMANYEYYGYPMDFLTSYQEGIQAATPATVLAAAKRNIRYPEVATLIVGTKENFSESLAELGAYQEIDITIPEPEGAEIPEATAETLKKGQDLLAKAAAATGIEAFGKVTDLAIKDSGSLKVQGMELTISAVTTRTFPGDCERSEIKLPMGTLIQAYCDGEGWMDMMQGPQAMPAEEAARFKEQQSRDLVRVCQNYPELKLQALDETADVEGMTCAVVFVHSDLVKGWKIYLDQATGRIARMDYKDKDFTGSPVLASEILLDYRAVNGFQWPHQRKILHDGEQVIDMKTESIVVNGGVEDALFKMPSE